jgi:hypothetical protein
MQDAREQTVCVWFGGSTKDNQRIYNKVRVKNELFQDTKVEKSFKRPSSQQKSFVFAIPFTAILLKRWE